MKLLLTSAGFENPNIGKKFLQLVGKPPSAIKIIFIPTAARSREELKYVNEAKKEIINTGVFSKNIKVLNLDRAISYSEVSDFDVIYVCGGNTFFLLNQVRKTGFDKIIVRFVKEGKLYVGVSAGSIIAGLNVEIAVPFDENDVGIADFTGLGLVEAIISPHYTEQEQEIIVKYRRKWNYPVIPLTDQQAYLVVDDKAEVTE